jgi:threonine dehydratase
VFRFSFPERTGALGVFLVAVKNPKWNISLFHYRNYGGDMGKVMIGMQVPPESASEFVEFLGTFKYNFVEETANPIYKQFLQ